MSRQEKLAKLLNDYFWTLEPIKRKMFINMEHGSPFVIALMYKGCPSIGYDTDFFTTNFWFDNKLNDKLATFMEETIWCVVDEDLEKYLDIRVYMLRKDMKRSLYEFEIRFPNP